ncbi:MAG: hypothetical protein Tsb002_27680 [Wenzhouxiangellaceae bacterium]
MTSVRVLWLLTLLLICTLDAATAQVRGGGTIQFDQTVTPDIIFGSGNLNGGFTTDRRNGIEIGLRGKLRFNANGQPQDIYNSNGDGSYTFIATVAPGQSAATPQWNFDWSVNTDFDNSSGLVISDLRYELGLDGDPGEGVDYLVFDPITPGKAAPFFDHAIGTNVTPAGGGASAADATQYQTLIDNNNVVQNSWRYSFFLNGALAGFNPKLEGIYDIYLLARDQQGTVLARSDIRIIMIKPPLAFNQNATPEVIMGNGITNGAFTSDRRNGIEAVLRAKLRFNAMGQAENTFNSLGDGSYRFQPGQAVGQSAQTPEWGFEWSVNSDYHPTISSNLVLSDLTYELGLDGDPSQATDFLVFDPITPVDGGPTPDHAIGTNATPQSGGTVAADAVQYQTLLNNNNVAQNSWRYPFFLSGPLAAFDPTVEGVYTLYFLARDSAGVEVARTQIQVLVGNTAVAGDVAEVAITKTTTATGTQFAGDSFDYVLTVTNSDVATATNVLISDELPDNLMFDGGSCDDGAMANEAGQLITFNLADLPSGATTVCTLSVTVVSGGVIENTATVSADNDFDPVNNTATVRLLGVIESIGLSGDFATATDNDYTRINNVLQSAQAGDQIILAGLFDWTESNAFDSWSRGSDDIADTDDDFSILLPAGAGSFTLTAQSFGDATIRGPGDLPGFDLEGFLVVSSNDNANIEISNLIIENFDLGIGFFFVGGGVNVYDNTRILNNRIRVATDIAGSTAAGEGFQNIGLHFSFGDNQLIANNIIEIPGDGESSRPVLSAASVAMQSNTSGNAYEGLIIEDNIVRVLNAASSDPEVVIGIWENSNTFQSNIIIRNNRFENMSPLNDAASNLQEGFRITSQTSPTTGDGAVMIGNYVAGANVAYQWLPGRFGADYQNRAPLLFIANTAIDSGAGVRLDSNGSADMRCNRFVNNTEAIVNVTVDNIASTANDNWWGCNAGPNMGLCDGFDAGANITTATWLVAELSANPGSVQIGGTSDLTVDVSNNNIGSNIIDCTLPDGVPVDFGTDLGMVMPATATTVAAVAPAVYLAPMTTGVATISAAIDNELLSTPIQIAGAPQITAVSPDPLPGNVLRVEATVTGDNFIPETVILADGVPRATQFVDANTVIVTLREEDLVVMNTGTIDLVADNTAIPGGGQSPPFTADILNDLLFRDSFEDPL